MAKRLRTGVSKLYFIFFAVHRNQTCGEQPALYKNGKNPESQQLLQRCQSIYHAFVVTVVD
jgi:hypothetical protein